MNIQKKIKNNKLFKSHLFLKNKSLNDIMFAKYLASENIFRKKVYHLEVF